MSYQRRNLPKDADVDSFSTFIPEDLHIRQWSDIEPYLNALQRSNPQTLAGLKRLIRHYSDVLGVYAENSTVADTAYASRMDDAAAKSRSDLFLHEISPRFERATGAIDRCIVEHPQFKELRDDRYRQIRRVFEYSVSSQCDQNIPLELEITNLENRCEHILGTITVDIGEKKLPLPLAWRALDTADREERREVWFAIHEARSQVKAQLDDLFSAMISLRHRTGKRAGHKNYRRYEHFGSYPQHTIRDARCFHKIIEQHVVPIANDVTRNQRHRLGLRKKMLRPWDTDSSSWGFVAPMQGADSSPLFRSEGDLIRAGMETFRPIREEFAANLETMAREGLLDLEARSGKALTPYCEGFEVRRLPFISMHMTGGFNDLLTLVHEGGHAMHVFSTRREPLIFYRYYGTDYTLAETASIGMELLTSDFWPLPDAERKLAKKEYLEEIIRFLPWCAAIDKFQHWIYEHPRHTSEERDAYFGHLMDCFYPSDINWRGLERFRRNYWQQTAHIFSSPFYYIQYGFAYLMALQLYRNYQQDPRGTVRAFVRGLKLGASKPYPEVWKAMGISNYRQMSPRSPAFGSVVQELMGFTVAELDRLQ